MKPELVVTHLRLNPAAIAAAMMVPEPAVRKEMADNGRAVSFWGKYWVSQIYRAPIDQFNYEDDTTAVLGEFGALKTPRAVVRTMARGHIRFQRNVRIGAGRHCSQQDLIEDINSFDKCIVIAANRFPDVLFYPLDAKFLLSMALEGSLTPSGISARQFVGWVAERHSLVHHARGV